MGFYRFYILPVPIRHLIFGWKLSEFSDWSEFSDQSENSDKSMKMGRFTDLAGQMRMHDILVLPMVWIGVFRAML